MHIPMTMFLKNPIHVNGIGLHSGKNSSVHLRPGKNGTRFVVNEVAYPIDKIKVERTPRCTRLCLPNGNFIDMVEHMLAAIRIVSLADVDIIVEGQEIPVLDGSSLPWIEALESELSPTQTHWAKYYEVTKEVALKIGNSEYNASPAAFSLNCSIDFPNKLIGRQSIHIDDDSLMSLVSARTFALEEEIHMLQKANLALGGSLDNAVVVGKDKVLNPEGFRMQDECVRHKALDFIGDLHVTGLPIIGAFTIFAPGHASNNQFLEHMFSTDSIRLIETTSSRDLAA
jgi:UDP-3-O-[3-hydroxymyristoyl] N-acetylglucosamine deacetylase